MEFVAACGGTVVPDARKDISGAVIQMQRMPATDAIVVEVQTASGVSEYISFHRKFVEHRDKTSRPFLMCFDLRHAKDIANLDLAKDFMAMHSELGEVYKRLLVCTVVVTSNDVLRIFINGVLTTLYKPSRPVRFVKTPEDARAFVSAVLADPNSYHVLSEER